jgi:hypothetical protein
VFAFGGEGVMTLVHKKKDTTKIFPLFEHVSNLMVDLMVGKFD